MSLPLAIGLAAFVVLVWILLAIESDKHHWPREPDERREPDPNAIRYQPDGSEAGPGRFRFPNNNQKDQQL